MLLDLDDDEGDSAPMWGADVEESVLKEQEMILLDNPTGFLPQTIPQTTIIQTEPPKPKRQSRLHEFLPASTMKVINRLQAETQPSERKNIIIIDSSQQQQQQQLIQSTQLQPTQYLQEICSSTTITLESICSSWTVASSPKLNPSNITS